jgi:hypothetical protein
MERSHRLQTKNRAAIIVAFLLMLGLALFQGYRTTHDLSWAADVDFDRDISYVQGTLDGHYGMDPSYAGEYLWYNPLLFSVETGLVRITGLPVNIIVTRAGAWLNLLGPIFFFLMAALMLDLEIAIASTLSFLFLANGNILGWGAATYSPWLYPVCFAQWMFYLAILFCYKAFSTGKLAWFAILGASTGILFLAHAAPTVIMVLLVALLLSANLVTAIREKDRTRAGRHLSQAALTIAAFVIASLPLTWYVIGKYHLHSINREAFEYAEGIFIPGNFREMITANLSISFLIAVIGFIRLWKYGQNRILRTILVAWPCLAAIMYLYSTGVAQLDWRYHIHLPGTVPSFHYFFYLKAAQSLFFGFGFVWLVHSILRRLAPGLTPARVALALAAFTLVCSLTYYPFYSRRDDFTVLRNEALYKEKQKDKIDTYHFILDNIPAGDVILTPPDSSSLFPVMATGRKMVSTAFTFSNPYVDFLQRETDRISMVQYLRTGEPASAKEMFRRYKVGYALLPNTSPDNAPQHLILPAKTIYQNRSYTLYSLDSITPSSADRPILPPGNDKSKL